jgi:hypothetical protein
MNIEVLRETEIGKSLKYLQDYCDVYQGEFPELSSVHLRC